MNKSQRMELVNDVMESLDDSALQIKREALERYIVHSCNDAECLSISESVRG